MLAPPELTVPLGSSAAKILGAWACAGTTGKRDRSTTQMRKKLRRKDDLVFDSATDWLRLMS
jgi:hypothetical protein